MPLTVGSLKADLSLDITKFRMQLLQMQKLANAVTAQMGKQMGASLNANLANTKGVAGLGNILNKNVIPSINNAKKSANLFGASLNFAAYFRILDSVTLRFTGIGVAIGAVISIVGKLGEALGAAFDNVIERGKSFEAQMSAVAAVAFTENLDTSVGQQQFELLRQQAIKLGAEMIFTAEEVGQAQELMARAGFNVNEILLSTPGLLNAAAAEGMSLADTADIAASALRGFGLNADEMGMVADVLAKGSAISNASISSLGQSFKYIAPIAKTVGLEIQEVTATIGVLADLGLKGTMAGRNLASGLMYLSRPIGTAAKIVKEFNIQLNDQNGNFKDIGGILEELTKLTEGYTEKDQLKNVALAVGLDNAKTYLAILKSQYKVERDGKIETISGIEMIKERTEALKDSAGAAQEMAEIRLDNLSGDLEKLRGDADSLAIALFDKANPALREFVQTFNRGLESIAPVIVDVFGKFMVFAQELYEAVMPELIAGWEGFASAVTDSAPEIEDSFAYLAAIAVEAAKWGAGLIKNFAIGMGKAVKDVVRILKFIGDVIRFWLKPNSPPKIVPDLDEYGREAGQLYIDSFAQADIQTPIRAMGNDIIDELDTVSTKTQRELITMGTAVGQAFTSGMQNWNTVDFDIYSTLTKDVEDVIRSLGDSGALASDAIVPAIQKSRDALRWVVDDLHNWGEVSEDAIQATLGSIGDVTPEVENLVRSYANMQRSALNVSRAQEELNRVTEEYSDKLKPLREGLDIIQAEQRRVRDAKRLADLQDDLASGDLDAYERRLAELEISEILAQQKLDSAEEEEKAAIAAAQTSLDAAEKIAKADEVAYNAAKDQMSTIADSNALLSEQIKLLKDIAETNKPGGSSGGDSPYGDLDLGDPTGFDDVETAIEEVSLYVSTLDETFSDVNTSIEDFKSAFATARDDVQKFFDIFKVEVSPFAGFSTDIQTNFVLPWENAKNKITTDILPILETLRDRLNEIFTERTTTQVSDFSTSWDSLSQSISNSIPVLTVGLAGLGATILSGLVGALPGIMTTIDGIVGMFTGTFTLIGPVVQGLIKTLFLYFTGDWKGAFEEAQRVVENTKNGIFTIVRGMSFTLVGLFQTLVGTMAGIWDGLYTSITGKTSTLAEDVNTAIETFKFDLITKFEQLRHGSYEHWLALTGGISGNLINVFIPGMKPFFDLLVDVDSKSITVFDNVKNAIADTIKVIRDLIFTMGTIVIPQPLQDLIKYTVGKLNIPVPEVPNIQPAVPFRQTGEGQSQSNGSTIINNYTVNGTYPQNSTQSAADELRIIRMIQGVQ